MFSALCGSSSSLFTANAVNEEEEEEEEESLFKADAVNEEEAEEGGVSAFTCNVAGGYAAWAPACLLHAPWRALISRL